MTYQDFDDDERDDERDDEFIASEFDTEFDTEFGDDKDDDDAGFVPCPYCRCAIHEDAVRCPHCERYISAEDMPPQPKPWWLVIGVIASLYVVYLWIKGRP